VFGYGMLKGAISELGLKRPFATFARNIGHELRGGAH
jgi:hypothetical protein